MSKKRNRQQREQISRKKRIAGEKRKQKTFDELFKSPSSFMTGG